MKTIADAKPVLTRIYRSLLVLGVMAIAQLLELPFRTTASHSIFQLAVVNGGGERARRGTLLWRWAIVWFPLFVPMLLVFQLIQYAEYAAAFSIALVVANGLRINDKNSDGSTPLHAAAFVGRTESVKKLIGLGADLRIRNKDGSPPLDAARVEMGIVQFIAGMVGLPIDTVKVESGKRETAFYLKGLAEAISSETGGARVIAIDSAASSGSGKPENHEGGDKDSKGGTEEHLSLYLAATFMPVFHHLWFLYYLLWQI